MGDATTTVVLVGASGVGTAAIPPLLASRIATLVIVDDSVVDGSDSAAFAPDDLGRPRAEAARDAALRLAPDRDVRAVTASFDSRHALDLILDADVLVDASGHPPTRYLANDVAAVRGIPMVWGSASGWTGQVGVAWDARGVDYRDLFPTEPAAASDPPPPFPPLAAAVGALVAAETVKVLTGVGEPLIGRMLEYDARTGTAREVAFRRASPAPGSIDDRTAERAPDTAHSLTATQLKALVDSGEPFVLLDVREPPEAAIAQLPGSLLIPLRELPARLAELDPEAPTVVYCHHGIRSSEALGLLRQTGFAEVAHLTGGIDAWAREVDPGMARY